MQLSDVCKRSTLNRRFGEHMHGDKWRKRLKNEQVSKHFISNLNNLEHLTGTNVLNFL